MNATRIPEFADDESWLMIGPSVRIPKAEFTFSYVRSSGPGGQNVNKVSTKACLRWPVVESPSLDDAIKQRLLEKYRSRITEAGELLLTSQRSRIRARNAEDCLEKLHAMIASVLVPPKRRKKVKPTRASRERRLRQKRDRSTRKESRQRPKFDE